MAEPTSTPSPTSAASIPALQSRRVSFRKSISEASLPPSYLEQLEQKRKQLDESIHKYIASKEREYKNLERELSQRMRNGVLDGCPKVIEGGGENGGKRRTNSESTTVSTSELDGAVGGLGSPFLHSQRGAAIIATGRWRDSSCMVEEGEDEDGAAVERQAVLASLREHTTSLERDKELVGLMPPFLPALESDKEDLGPRGQLARSMSAPATSSSTTASNKAPGEADGDGDPKRARSDPSLQTTAQAKAKRPAQLVLASRTSSSGSSVDGRLTSAMKSPTQRERPNRKRVSLAVGDSIVAPSDSVPTSLSSNSHTPSHSRSRSSVVQEKDDIENVPAEESVPVNDSRPTNTSSAERTEHTVNPKPIRETEQVDEKLSKAVPSNLAPGIRSTTVTTSHTLTATIDPDGDFFDLEEDDDGGLVRHEADDLEEDNDEYSEESDRGGVVRRIIPAHASVLVSDEQHDDDTEAGLASESESTDGKAETVRLDFQPGSVVASQQPTNPGFRRPSVSRDPIFAGTDYETAAEKAADDEIYGSSYSRPATKGSFTVGSLGESFMERNSAEIRMRAANTLARREGEVES